MLFCKGQGKSGISALNLFCSAAYRSAFKKCFGGKPAAAGNVKLNIKRAVFNIGVIFCGLYVARGYKFKPYRLPNSGRAGVIAAA